MAELLTRLDLFEIGRRYVMTRAKRIDPEQVNVEGSDANIFVGSMSFVGQAISRQNGDRIRALLLDGAISEDLDRYALDRYSMTRKGAAAALGEVRFYRTAGGVAGTVPIGTKLVSLSGIEYVTLTAATFAAADLEKKANVRAVQAGKEYQVGANQIRKIDKPSILFDPKLQVNNDEKTAGGEPREPDTEFRERIRKFWTTARRGTKSAIEFGAQAVDGVSTARAVEVITGGGQPARVVQLYIADSSGVASASLGTKVRANLEDYRACGIAVVTALSIPQIVDVLLKLTFAAGVDTSTLTEAIRAAVVEFINSIAVNGTLYRADLYSILRRYVLDGLIVDDTSVVVPTGDLVPVAGRTLRTTIDNVKVT
jgi:uncharacterized phage protein gp47/JayE